MHHNIILNEDLGRGDVAVCLSMWSFSPSRSTTLKSYFYPCLTLISHLCGPWVVSDIWDGFSCGGSLVFGSCAAVSPRCSSVRQSLGSLKHGSQSSPQSPAHHLHFLCSTMPFQRPWVSCILDLGAIILTTNHLNSLLFSKFHCIFTFYLQFLIVQCKASWSNSASIDCGLLSKCCKIRYHQNSC